MKRNWKETMNRIDEAARLKANEFIKKADVFDETVNKKRQRRIEKRNEWFKKVFHTQKFSCGLSLNMLCKVYIWIIIISYPLIFTIPHIHSAVSEPLLSNIYKFETILFGSTKIAMILFAYFLTQTCHISNFFRYLIPCSFEIAYDLSIFGKLNMSYQSPVTAIFICAFMIAGLKIADEKITRKTLRYIVMCIFINLCWYVIISLNPEHGALIFSSCVLFYLFRNYMTAGLLIFTIFIGFSEGIVYCLLAAVLIFFKEDVAKEEFKKLELLFLRWVYPIIFTLSACIEIIFL